MKYKSLKLLITLIIVLSISSCQKESVVNQSDDYFPLQVGNYWELSYALNGNVSTITMSIDKIESLSGIDYYRMIQSINYTYPRYDTIYFRKTADGKVYERGISATEVLKFNFSDSLNAHWIYPIDPLSTDALTTRFPWNVTFKSKTDTVKRSNFTFENCYSYYYDQTQMADEEYSWCLAPGVGFVKLTGWVSHRITKARINGVEKVY